MVCYHVSKSLLKFSRLVKSGDPEVAIGRGVPVYGNVNVESGWICCYVRVVRGRAEVSDADGVVVYVFSQGLHVFSAWSGCGRGELEISFPMGELLSKLSVIPDLTSDVMLIVK